MDWIKDPGDEHGTCWIMEQRRRRRNDDIDAGMECTMQLNKYKFIRYGAKADMCIGAVRDRPPLLIYGSNNI